MGLKHVDYKEHSLTMTLLPCSGLEILGRKAPFLTCNLSFPYSVLESLCGLSFHWGKRWIVLFWIMTPCGYKRFKEITPSSSGPVITYNPEYHRHNLFFLPLNLVLNNLIFWYSCDWMISGQSCFWCLIKHPAIKMCVVMDV